MRDSRVAERRAGAVRERNAVDLYTARMARPGYSATYLLDFEQPIVEIEKQIDHLADGAHADRFANEIRTLEETRSSLLSKTYAALSPWQTVRVARHPHRPQTSDYIQ